MTKASFLTNRFTLVPLAVLALGQAISWAAPTVTNVRAGQRAGTKLVDVTYDLTGSGPMTVRMEVSFDGGKTFVLQPKALQGAIGTSVTAGTGKKITWDASVEFDNNWTPGCVAKILASEGTPNVPNGFRLIPSGSFEMGDSFAAFGDNSPALPVHTVHVNAFYIEAMEVTVALWNEVADWNRANRKGYDLSAAVGLPNYPAQANWYQWVAWCNARSEKEGLTPCYYTFRTKLTSQIAYGGETVGGNDSVLWTGNGYRLPTEAEWEKAARGGQVGKRFPWGDTITFDNAQYGIHPLFGRGLAPVGMFPVNGYGLYDVVGNAPEWAWDAFDAKYYASSPNSNPVGPDLTRIGNGVVRGNGDSAVFQRLHINQGGGGGLRCVRGL